MINLMPGFQQTSRGHGMPVWLRQLNGTPYTALYRYVNELPAIIASSNFFQVWIEDLPPHSP